MSLIQQLLLDLVAPPIGAVLVSGITTSSCGRLGWLGEH